MPRIPTSSLIAESLCAHSGVTFLAREIRHILRTTYSRPTSSKSISKSLILLEEEHPMISRRETSNKEKSLYNVRYIYLHGHFNPETGEVM